MPHASYSFGANARHQLLYLSSTLSATFTEKAQDKRPTLCIGALLLNHHTQTCTFSRSVAERMQVICSALPIMMRIVMNNKFIFLSQKVPPKRDRESGAPVYRQ